MDPTHRFSDRVDNYARYRPGYPSGVLHILQQETALTRDARIADIGSGTGISSEIFLRNGNAVFGVEPNANMRRAADQSLRRYPAFHSVAGTAEITTLPAQSVDYVVAGQSFHWFDALRAKEEFARILAPGGWVVLLWNSRRVDSSAFLRAYETLLQRYGTDYREVQHRNIDLARLAGVFAGGSFTRRTLSNEQRLNLEELRGRLLSSSYTPAASHSDHQPMLLELERIFEQHHEAGRVTLEYEVELYFGHVSQSHGS